MIKLKTKSIKNMWGKYGEIIIAIVLSSYVLDFR
jgi:hypothetical protein